MKKKIKLYAIAAFVILIPMLIFKGCVSGPVAKVHVKTTFYHDCGTELHWVDVLEVYKTDRFESLAQKVSEDGCRANLNTSICGERSQDCVYYLTNDNKLVAEKPHYLMDNFICWVLLSVLLGCILVTLKEKMR